VVRGGLVAAEAFNLATEGIDTSVGLRKESKSKQLQGKKESFEGIHYWDEEPEKEGEKNEGGRCDGGLWCDCR
jgi:hypothetical protein